MAARSVKTARPPSAVDVSAGLRAGPPAGGGGGGGGGRLGMKAGVGGGRGKASVSAGIVGAAAGAATAAAGGGAARDFDPAVPVRDRTRTVLRECRALVSRLFESVDALVAGRLSNDAVMQPEQVMEALLGRQRVLRALLEELTEHQRTAAHIAHLTATLSSTSAALAALHTSLSSAEASLQAALDTARPRLAAAAASTSHPLSVADLIASGARLAPAIAAPSGWAPPQPLGGSVPPAVTDEAMRAGRLASLAGGVFAPPGGKGVGAGGGATEGAEAEEDADGSSDSESDEEGSV
ncbi:hypothetical protein MMPV_001835 [Pyropia vietnamensis]